MRRCKSLLLAVIISALCLALLAWPGLSRASPELGRRVEGAECDIVVRRVTDGDTFYNPVLIVLSSSNAIPRDMRHRLKDVYAPERPVKPKKPKTDPAWKDYGEAKKLYDQAIEDLGSLIVGKLVRINVLKDQDPRGGLIVDVFLCQSDGSRLHVNEAMRAKGWTKYGRGMKLK